MVKGKNDKPDKNGKTGAGRTEKKVSDDGHDCLKHLKIDPGSSRAPYCGKCGLPL